MQVMDTLREVLNRLRGQKILVAGDLMWDEYIRGDVSRISPEAPVPVVLVSREERLPGGATNVLRNLVELGCDCGILGVVGDDEAGSHMIRELESWGLNSLYIEQTSDRPTIMKTRIVARNQQLLRVDREIVKPISAALEQKMLQRLESDISNYKAVILSDYDKGVLTPAMIRGIIELAKARNIFVAVDPQVRHFRHYKGADVMTPNEKEASEGIGMAFPHSDEDTIEIGNKILAELQLNHLLITRSQKGMALFEPPQNPQLVPTVAREVYDVTGAGDTVISVYTAAIAAGASRLQAVLLANIAGGIVVGKLGTATASVREIEERLSDVALMLRS